MEENIMIIVDKLTYWLGLTLCLVGIAIGVVLFGALIVAALLSFIAPVIILGLGAVIINKHL